jgi:branched-chain amino acid:cation transporter, LIVCS family
MNTQESTLPQETNRTSSFLTVGFALFSMFFGAGNLVFPLLIGQSTGTNTWFAILGLGITAVIVPFLGLAVMILFQANYHRFFGRIGKVPGLVIILLLQLILGPLGVIPRLVTLMHATAAPYLSNIPLLWFSVLALSIVFVCSFKKDQLIRFLGAFLTPILLLSLTALVVAGLINEPSAEASKAVSAGSSFFEGLLGGYNTMDLLAAFLFASVILPHFQREISLECPERRRSSLIKKLLSTSFVAASLLLLTYIGLCLVSSRTALDPSCLPQEMLNTISLKLLGPLGGAVAAICIIVACLTTAMTLATIFAEYLRKEICREKLSGTTCLLLTLIITLFFSLLGFQEIVAILGPILQVIYPGLILLTVLNLLYVLYGKKTVKIPVFFAFIVSAAIYIAQRFF